MNIKEYLLFGVQSGEWKGIHVVVDLTIAILSL